MLTLVQYNEHGCEVYRDKFPTKGKLIDAMVEEVIPSLAPGDSIKIEEDDGCDEAEARDAYLEDRYR